MNNSVFIEYKSTAERNMALKKMISARAEWERHTSKLMSTQENSANC